MVDRIGRTSIVVCIAFAAIALAIWGVRVAAGVLGGGLLIGISFYTLGHGVAALVLAATGGGSAAKSGRQHGAEIGAALRFTRFSCVRYDCAFAPAPDWAAGGRIISSGGRIRRSGPPSREESSVMSDPGDARADESLNGRITS